MGRVDEAGRAIAGLLTYNPGPGIYSRLERAIQDMPANVRVQELPGLLKRYKEGVPGWELKATDLDSTIAGRDVVPRDELLAAVRERSPVHTHREIVLGGSPPMRVERDLSEGSEWLEPARQDKPSPLGSGVSHFAPKYEDYGQGGDDYAELLLLQPGAKGEDFGSHWGNRSAVAHARFDTHGDALRINELQSDLGIHNRKQREIQGEYIKSAGGPPEYGWLPEAQTLPFPMEDAWAELLIKRLALEAARKGHRAIEVASPRAIADKVGGNIDNYEHFYGKVVPGALERLGRKMGGLTPDARTDDGFDIGPWANAHADVVREAKSLIPARAWESFQRLRNAYRYSDAGIDGSDDAIRQFSHELAMSLDAAGRPANEMMPSLMPLAQRYAREDRALAQVSRNAADIPAPPPRRYIMSDEMRRRLIEQGVGASVLAPLMMQGEE